MAILVEYGEHQKRCKLKLVGRKCQKFSRIGYRDIARTIKKIYFRINKSKCIVRGVVVTQDIFNY